MGRVAKASKSAASKSSTSTSKAAGKVSASTSTTSGRVVKKATVKKAAGAKMLNSVAVASSTALMSNNNATSSASSSKRTLIPPAKLAKQRKKKESESTVVDLGPLIPQRSGNRVLACGSGDVGQLGTGKAHDKKFRGITNGVLSETDVRQAIAGALHSVFLTEAGEVYTCGNNDEGALGRKQLDPETNEEIDEYKEPGKVDMKEKVVMVAAGDSYSAALSESGSVYVWGTFRGKNGRVGLCVEQTSTRKERLVGMSKEPQKVYDSDKKAKCVKISGGSNHVCLLLSNGTIYTFGCGTAGQLGRLPSRNISVYHEGDQRLNCLVL